jgi:tetratricopeptide (TPR) repeat protein
MDDTRTPLPVIEGGPKASGNGVPVPAVIAILVIGVAATGYLLFGAYSSSQTGRQGGLWLALDAAKDDKEVAELARKNQGTMVGAVAQLDMARAQLAMALREYPAPSKENPVVIPALDPTKDKDKKDAPIDIKSNLEQAVQGFDLAAKKLKTVAALDRECAIGAARALEALGRFDEARARYEALSKNPANKDSLIALEAERRARKLASPDYVKQLATLQNQLRPTTP